MLVFFLWLALPILSWIVYRRCFPSKTGIVSVFIVTLLVGYGLYVGAIWILDKEYEDALNKYDLDGDGSFSNEEYTLEAQTAMKRLTNDTGRTFAPIVAGPVTFVWVSVWYSTLGVFTWMLKGFRTLRSRHKTKMAERAGAANPCACGTSGTSAAEQPLVPEASSDT